MTRRSKRKKEEEKEENKVNRRVWMRKKREIRRHNEEV